MVNVVSAALVAVSFLAHLATAIPAPEAAITPPPAELKPPPTTCTTDALGCYSICPTPTITAPPTIKCPKIGIVCPFVRCAPFVPITTTSTHFCRGTSTCASTVASTSCETVPTVTVVGHCQTGCPDPCPLNFSTVDVACPTNPPQL